MKRSTYHIDTIDRDTPLETAARLIKGAVVIHPAVDLDCIGAAYELLSWSHPNEIVHIVIAPKNLDKALLDTAAFLLDMGDEYAPERGRIDHHHIENNTTCATEMVYQWRVLGSAYPQNGLFYPKHSPQGYAGLLNHPLKHTFDAHAEFVQLVTQGDLGKIGPDINESRRAGLHALVSSWHMQRVPDAHIVHKAFELLDEAFAYALENAVPMTEALLVICNHRYLDDLIAYAQKRMLAEKELETKCVYRSTDGKVIAIEGGSSMMSHVAYEQGAVLVVYHAEDVVDEVMGITQYGATGVARGPEHKYPNVSEIVKLAEQAVPFIQNETFDWYKRLPFMSGLSPKAGNTRPIRVRLEELAAAIDAAWKR